LLLETLQPGGLSMDILRHPNHKVDWFDCMFYSFVTLTSLGCGDMVPISAQCRSLSVLEAVSGLCTSLSWRTSCQLVCSPQMRSSVIRKTPVQHGFRAEDIAAARADLTLAEGQLKQTEVRWAEREVLSPAAAAVETMDLRPGDLLPANSPVAQLLEGDQLYLMVYVPETQIGDVQIGKAAQIRVDSSLGKRSRLT
jgi:hypothetical protein